MRIIFLFTFLTLSLVNYSQNKALQFKNVGPSRGGRVTAVCGVNDSANIFYMGATGGGVWKTTDNGNHWKNISDGYFSTPSIGAITVDQSNPNTIYVGTGSDGMRSNVIIGKGIYKSIDAGETWTFLGLKNAGQTGAIEIHPKNSKILLTAVIGQPFRKSKERGIYKSKDGGKTWEQKLFLSDSVGAVDVEFAPNNPNIVYAAMWRAERKPWTIISGDTTGGIFKSIDGGENWKKVTTGLPQSLIGKIDFAVSPDKPERVWALIQAPLKEEGLYKSDDYGETWKYIQIPEKTKLDITYRPFYFTNISANPKNADELWSGTKKLWHTSDGGNTWNNYDNYPHEDHHCLWINPNNPSLLIAGNDGGATVSVDKGENWSTLFNQPTAELYSLDIDDNYPYYLYSGQQDNTTIKVPHQSPRKNGFRANNDPILSNSQYWEAVGGCETGPAVPKPGSPHIVYANCKGQFGVYNSITGFQQNYYVGAESLYGNHPDDITYRFQRVVPIEVSPHDPNTVYYGSQHVHKTTNGGVNWKQISPDLTANDSKYRMRSGGPIDEDISGEEYYNVLYAIEESPVEQNVIWTGSNDGLFHLSKDGGKTWNNITPKDLPPRGRVSNIHSSSIEKGKAYYAVYRDYLGDDKPYLYITHDYGNTWELSVNGIPTDYPVRVVREDNKRKGLLFAGTEFGLYISFDDGLSWQSFQQNLPIVPITDLKIFRDNLNISTLGRSFWIMEDISVLREFNSTDTNIAKLYVPSNTIGENVNIYFSSGNKNSTGKVLFTFKNENNMIIHQKEVNYQDMPANKLGIRKTIWDLKHYLITKGEKDFSGPKVAPGKYTIEIVMNETKLNADFNFTLHPNLKKIGTTTEHLKKQEELALKTAKLLVKVRSIRKKLENELKTEKSNKKKTEITKKLNLLIKGKERYDQPKLEDHIKYLYRMISGNPQQLGEDAFNRYNQLHASFQSLEKLLTSK